jgi:hypothetical protein
MHTVVETPAYLASAHDVGLSAQQREEIVSYLARHPDAGELIPGTAAPESCASPDAAKGRVVATGSSRFSPPRISRYFCSTCTEKVRVQICLKLDGTSCARC